MNRLLKYIFLALLIANTTMKAQNLAFYFELIPEEQLPHLKPDMRKGMVGLYELGERPARVPNLLKGVCVLDTLSDSYLSMHTSGISTLAVKMLESKVDSTEILAVMHNVEATGTLDSSLEFFTKTWSQLDGAQRIDTPTIADFYKQNADVTLEDFGRYCTPLLVSYRMDGETLVASIDPEKYLPKEVYEKIAPALSDKQVKYKWNKETGKFEKI